MSTISNGFVIIHSILSTADVRVSVVCSIILSVRVTVDCTFDSFEMRTDFNHAKDVTLMRIQIKDENDV